MLAFFFNDGREEGHRLGAGALVRRSEEQAGAVVAGLGEPDAEASALAAEELVRELDEDAGAIAGVRLGARGAAVVEVFQRE